MAGGPVGSGVLAALGIVFFALGFTLIPACGIGYALPLFGASIFLIALAIFPAGGALLLGLAGFIAFLLVVAGLISSHGGCWLPI